MTWWPRADVGGGKWALSINVTRRKAAKATAQAPRGSSLNATLGSLVLNGVGVEVASPFAFGQLVASFDDVLVEATGAMVLGASATMALSPLTLSAESRLRILGGLSVEFGAVSASATGAIRISGSLTGTLGALTLNASTLVTLAAPTLSIVSADGDSPVNLRVSGATDIGVYAELAMAYGVENASSTVRDAGAAGIGTGGVTNFQTYEVIMQGDDWALSDSTVEGFVEPSGAYTAWARYRTSPYDPGNSIDSAWSNSVYDTISSSSAVFAHTTSTDYKNNLTFTNSFKTIQGQNQNSGQSARATIAGADKGQVEITLDVVTASSSLWLGFENGSTNFSVFDVRPGANNSNGVTVALGSGASSITVLWNSGANSQSLSIGSASAVGDKIAIVPNRTTNQLRVYHTRGATRTLLGTVTVSNLSTFTRFWAGMKRTDKITANFGGEAWTLTSGDVIYG